jgi:mannose-6-phosphate isomerase-like protein (cupin superfamily)
MTTPPPRPPYEIAHLDDIPPTESDDSYGLRLAGEWKQIRHHLMIREFAANAFVATAAGQEIVHEHFERPNDATSEVGDEELYFVFKGSATVKLSDESVDVGPGALIFVGDPSVVRSVTAKEAGTIVLTFGTNPGVRFAVSSFEQEMSPPPQWSV